MLLIGFITFAMSFIGSIIGAKVGSKYEKKAELAGGIILILLGIKFFIEAIF
jgi:putative Mn2+ efflux pump MntP